MSSPADSVNGGPTNAHKRLQRAATVMSEASALLEALEHLRAATEIRVDERPEDAYLNGEPFLVVSGFVLRRVAHALDRHLSGIGNGPTGRFEEPELGLVTAWPDGYEPMAKTEASDE